MFQVQPELLVNQVSADREVPEALLALSASLERQAHLADKATLVLPADEELLVRTASDSSIIGPSLTVVQPTGGGGHRGPGPPPKPHQNFFTDYKTCPLQLPGK